MSENKKTVKVRDLKPNKDAKGGGHAMQGHSNQGHSNQGSANQGNSNQGSKNQGGIHHNN
jgi:hypothetical protein